MRTMASSYPSVVWAGHVHDLTLDCRCKRELPKILGGKRESIQNSDLHNPIKPNQPLECFLFPFPFHLWLGV